MSVVHESACTSAKNRLPASVSVHQEPILRFTLKLQALHSDSLLFSVSGKSLKLRSAFRINLCCIQILRSYLDVNYYP